ncbi:hypothetical protein VTN31DRAFT_6827 [Thermomyces dupontii]|uniref:uncharacterized protein n=1 Tax=Talaromyces thermophilus TaxID=28565 RepID=UPI003742110F
MGAPNQTLYIKNLPDKIKKTDMKTLLYTLFSTYGTVLDVVVMRTDKMRGQAHVVFRDVQASTQAMRALQGFEICGKEMNIAYAKGSSHIIAKLRGTYVPPTAPAEQSQSTDLQKSIFSGPPSSAPVETKPGEKAAEAQAPHGVKRPREDDSDAEEAPMEEGEESDVPMEASSDED